MKKLKISLWGAWPPNLEPDPHHPRNLSSPLRGAHDAEKVSEIAQRLAEKIDFEKNFLAPPGGQTGSKRDHLTISAESYRGVLDCVKI